MKFTPLSLLSLLPLALSSPTPENSPSSPLLYAPATPGSLPTLSSRSLAKRAVTGTVTASLLKHRRCPRTSCTADGEYARGTHIKIRCYEDENTSVVEGNPFWGKLQASGAADNNWVSLYYVDWSGGIDHC